MPKESSSGRTASAPSRTVPEFAAFGGFTPPNVEAAFRASNAWMKGIGTLNEEMISFSQEQLGKCVEAGQSLLKCSSFEQAISIQSDLAKSALDSYYREANKLISITSDIAREAMAQESSAAPAPSAAAAGDD